METTIKEADKLLKDTLGLPSNVEISCHKELEKFKSNSDQETIQINIRNSPVLTRINKRKPTKSPTSSDEEPFDKKFVKRKIVNKSLDSSKTR